ncbi:MAG: hypothetical protein ACLQDV_00725 [Candidatus Binataceae bacterium]
MNPTEYAREIEAAFQGEVQGAAMFHALSERLQDPEHRYKMRVLEQLEIETGEALRPLVERLQGAVCESATARETGIAQASVLAAMPWAKLMHVFHREVTKFVAHFEEVEKAGPATDSGILAALTAHERALQSFSQRECSGAGANSLEPVVKLLRVTPARAE